MAPNRLHLVFELRAAAEKSYVILFRLILRDARAEFAMSC